MLRSSEEYYTYSRHYAVCGVELTSPGLLLVSRLNVYWCCNIAPYYCHMYFLELKAAVTELSKQCCRMLLL